MKLTFENIIKIVAGLLMIIAVYSVFISKDIYSLSGEAQLWMFILLAGNILLLIGAFKNSAVEAAEISKVALAFVLFFLVDILLIFVYPPIGFLSLSLLVISLLGGDKSQIIKNKKKRSV